MQPGGRRTQAPRRYDDVSERCVHADGEVQLSTAVRYETEYLFQSEVQDETREDRGMSYETRKREA